MTHRWCPKINWEVHLLCYFSIIYQAKPIEVINKFSDRCNLIASSHLWLHPVKTEYYGQTETFIYLFYKKVIQDIYFLFQGCLTAVDRFRLLGQC